MKGCFEATIALPLHKFLVADHQAVIDQDLRRGELSGSLQEIEQVITDFVLLEAGAGLYEYPARSATTLLSG